MLNIKRELISFGGLSQDARNFQECQERTSAINPQMVAFQTVPEF